MIRVCINVDRDPVPRKYGSIGSGSTTLFEAWSCVGDQTIRLETTNLGTHSIYQASFITKCIVSNPGSAGPDPDLNLLLTGSGTNL